MKFNTKIPKPLKQAYNEELKLYSLCLENKQYNNAWYHLERSHIIGQSYPIEHTYSHWLMLKFGFMQKDTKEVLGQIIRLLVGGWKSFIDHVPLGNTGGANVPPLKSMIIPNDIKNLFNSK
ncbi:MULTISPECIES: DUF3703 domain-containing protein [Flavobacteriaceae]|uniref:DUF3703 domain-containing protein n=2 Tax=Flavobacteriaceae TaxID=49546 RepID=A0A1D8PBS7_9FLAO|nr:MULTISPECIES: DUF3703 domain-containing protein [Flavobacteriaceae]AOW22026.1 hypothetical protein LPB138_05490 [Urechidicola croceus]APG66486.1 hypothetical protein LPB136_11295 [Tenacibaculum todarodis]